MRIILIALLLLFLGCTTPQFYEEGTYFYIERDNSIQPVWVQGNVKSGTFVIYVHGGPGNSAVAEATLNLFDPLEEEVALVYWDQRGSGLSDGNPKTISNEAIAEDLDLLIDVIHSKYNADRIVLMGHSYGVMTVACYLSEPRRKAKIHGCIAIDGTDSFEENWPYSINWSIDEMLKDSIRWNERIEQYRNMLKSGISFDSFDAVKEHLNRVDTLNGMFHDDSFRAKGSGDQIFLSPIGLGMVQNEKNCGYRLDKWWESDYSQSADYSGISVLIMSGVFDGVYPRESCESFYNRIESETKSFSMFEQSGHHPHYEENEKFNDVVSVFLRDL